MDKTALAQVDIGDVLIVVCLHDARLLYRHSLICFTSFLLFVWP